MQLINPRRPYTAMVTVLGLSVLIATLLFLQVNEARLSIMKYRIIQSNKQNWLGYISLCNCLTDKFILPRPSVHSAVSLALKCTVRI